ncbi:hypothetical protein HQ865_19640 [Mucilaginibacter mali]|uniref:Uncharacterized protein n=1 Tax=Mucilaginibacter mali TaxID=2740462 RepID=A0A7D4ULH6_9SPHI|nr:hypothetical protein [Mucilaginibacter mali]QKJ31882.1 hypothetical protein HQ865_19640 [Mucilaginibacter mali]
MAKQSEDFVPQAINYVKSISKERVVYLKHDWTNYFEWGFAVIFTAIIIDAAIESFSVVGYPFVAFSAIFSLLLLTNLYYQNKLVKVDGVGLLWNKEDGMKTLREFYDDLTFDASVENIIRDIKLNEGFKNGRDIVVLLDDKTVYFHKSTFGRGNSPSSFFGIINYLKCKKIAERFQDIQQNYKQELPS